MRLEGLLSSLFIQLRGDKVVRQWVRDVDVEDYAKSLVPVMEELGTKQLLMSEVLDLVVPTGELPYSLDHLSYGELKRLVGRLIISLYGEDVDPIKMGPRAGVSIALLDECITLSLRKKSFLEDIEEG
jgi:hypothetical protein